jgi:TonB family protein
MKAIVLALLIAGSFNADLHAQTDCCMIIDPIPQRVQMSADVAAKLLIHKVDPDVCPRFAMAARVTGTVVVAVRIGKNGDVQSAKVTSGPAMLRQPVLDAIGKYKYKPYLLNVTAVEVVTTVSVVVGLDDYHVCHSG